MHPAIESFNPIGNAVPLNTSTVSANVQLPSRNQDENRQLQVSNSSTAWMFVKQGKDNTVSATADVDYAVAPGAVVVITLDNNTTWVAAVLSTGTGKAYFHIGQGV